MSLEFYRGPDFKGLDDELSEIEQSKDSSDRSEVGRRRSFAFLCSPHFWRPFSSIGVIFILLRLSIFSVLPSYAATIVQETGTDFDPMLGAVIVGVTRFFANISMPLLLSVLRKKVILIVASVAATAAIILSKHKMFGALMYVLTATCIPFPSAGLYSDTSLRQSLESALSVNLYWVPLVGVSVVSMAHGTGGPVVQVLLNESFPTEVRAASVGTVTAVQFAIMVANIKAYPFLVADNALGVAGTMYLYAVMAAALVIWSALTVKDTENKSLVEVEEMFSREQKPNYGTNH